MTMKDTATAIALRTDTMYHDEELSTKNKHDTKTKNELDEEVHEG